MSVILNEKEFAEECLKNGIGENKPYHVLSILAKYYYYIMGFRKKKIVSLLTDYLSNHYPKYEFNKQMWDDNIEKISSHVGKYSLYQISGVSITSAELESIDKLETKLLRRLAFTLLCLGKLGDAKNQNNNGWVNIDSKEIFKLARIACGVDERDYKLGILYQKGMLDFAKRNDSMSCRVTFIDNSSDEVMFVSDFRELGYEYIKHTGGNYIRCRECGILIHNNKNGTRVYCDKCKSPSPMSFKIISCVDCGIDVKIASKNHETTRCPYCYSVYRRNRKNEIQRERRYQALLKSAQKKDD